MSSIKRSRFETTRATAIGKIFKGESFNSSNNNNNNNANNNNANSNSNNNTDNKSTAGSSSLKLKRAGSFLRSKTASFPIDTTPTSLSKSSSAASVAQKPVPPHKKLYIASGAGDVEGVHSALQENANVNARGEHHNTPLHAAAAADKSITLTILLAKCANATLANNTGNTPLHVACGQGPSCVPLLLEAPNVNIECTNVRGNTPLHTACFGGNLECVRLLLDKGALVSSANNEGWTALHFAAKAGHHDILLLLISNNASVKLCETSGKSPLFLAAAGGHLECVRTLLAQGADVSVCCNSGDTPLHVAVRQAACCSYSSLSLSLVTELIGGDLGVTSSTGSTALHIACLYGCKAIVSELLSRSKAEVNKPTCRGNTPLHLVFSRPRYHEYNPYLGGAEEERMEIGQLLVNSGATYNVRNGKGMTPIHMAARYNLLSPLWFLLQLGEQVDIADYSLRTPLHYAASGGFAACAAVLRESGASAQRVDSQGCTPLHLAGMQGCVEIVEQLLKGTEQEFVNMADECGNTALHYAARGKHSETVKSLLQRGGIPGLSNNKRQTPLHLACNNTSLQSTSLSEKCVTALLEAGANINSEDDGGLTPLDYSIMSPHGTNCLAPFLITRNGCNTGNRDSRMDYAIHRAALGGCLKCTAVLLFGEKGLRGNSGTELTGYKERYALHHAAALGRMDALGLLLDNATNPDVRSCTRLTPLHLAARYGHLECAAMLIEAGADVDAKCNEDWTPLHHACAMGHKSVVSYLIESGAQVNSADKLGRTALHKATYYGHPECVLLLVERGAQVNQANSAGETPVQWAAIRGLTSALVFMSALGADLAATTKKGNTAVHLAAQYGHVDTISFLAEKDPHSLRSVTNKGRASLHVAARYGKEEVAKVLLGIGADVNQCDFQGNTPLHIAAKHGSPHVISKLLLHNFSVQIKGADVNFRNYSGETALHLAAGRDHLSCVNQLLEAGADVSIRDNSGYTPLRWALRTGGVECARKLLERGKPEVDDMTGRTLMHWAACRNWVDFGCVLLDVNVLVTSTDNNLDTPLHLAAAHGAIAFAEFLLLQESTLTYATNRHGRTPVQVAMQFGQQTMLAILLPPSFENNIVKYLSSGDSYGQTCLHLAAANNSPQCVSALLECGANVNVVSTSGASPLFLASAAGALKCAELLIEAKADFIPNNEGNTPIHIAAQYGHLQVLAYLLSRGFSVDARGCLDRTPLHIACGNGHLQIVVLLLDREVNVNVTDEKGWTPIHYAAQSNSKEIISLLLKKGANLTSVDRHGMGPHHVAADTGQDDALQFLVSKGADVNATTAGGDTIISLATANGHNSIITSPKKFGAKPPPPPPRKPQ